MRTTPRRVLTGDAAEGLYFSPELVPVVHHAEVRALGDHVVRDVLTQVLYSYLDFTASLEHKVVNEVAARLADGEDRISLSSDVRFEAYKLYCDEAYHALAAADMKRQVQRASGLDPVSENSPSFLQQLDGTLEPLGEEDRELARLLFAVVSETMISGTLRDIPRDPSVVDAVREVIHDHALDESYHHTYFSAILNHAWPQLGFETRLRIGPLIPGFVFLFLQPDLDRWARILGTIGFSAQDCARILDDSFPRERLVDNARQIAGRTIRLFERVGALEVPEIDAAFRDAGLVGDMRGVRPADGQARPVPSAGAQEHRA